jgi:DNA-binding MarR family transcriptional regulator
VSQPAVSRHLKVLEEAGLISRSRRATSRISHLEAQPLREATIWLAEYQRFWDERYDQLDELLSKLQEPERKDKNHEQDPDQRTGRRPVRRRHPRIRRSP